VSVKILNNLFSVLVIISKLKNEPMRL